MRLSNFQTLEMDETTRIAYALLQKKDRKPVARKPISLSKMSWDK